MSAARAGKFTKPAIDVVGSVRRSGVRDGGIVVATATGALTVVRAQVGSEGERAALDLLDDGAVSVGDTLG